MQKYDKYLARDEKLKLVTGYSQIHLREDWLTHAIIPGVVFVVLGFVVFYFLHLNFKIGLAVGFLLDSLISLVWVLITDMSHKYLLTSRRVIVKEGFWKIKLASVLYDKITHITVNQTFLERVILTYGTIVIDTAGSSGDEVTLDFVHEPIKFKNRLEELIHRHEHPLKKKPVIKTKKLLRSFDENFV